MTIASFEQLVQAVVRHLEVPVAPEGAEGDEPLYGFQFDHYGMEVRLIQASDDTDVRVQVFCNFGTLPVERECAGLRKLMEINLFLGNEGNTLFGCDAETGEVNFRFEHALSTIRLDSFFDALDRLAAQAAEWRHTAFLDDTADADSSAFSAFQFA